MAAEAYGIVLVVDLNFIPGITVGVKFYSTEERDTLSVPWLCHFDRCLKEGLRSSAA